VNVPSPHPDRKAVSCLPQLPQCPNFTKSSVRKAGHALSRRSLELKFRACLGHPPAVELRRIRIERAKRMLSETDLPVLKVALLSGFNSRQVFSTLFHEETGITPVDYRNEFRGDPHRQQPPIP